MDIQGGIQLKRYDERDMMFARMSRVKGTEQYEDYYGKNQELEVIDEELRENLPIGKSSDKYYDALQTPVVDAAFQFLDSIKILADGTAANELKKEASPKEFSNVIKSVAKLYGASDVKIIKSENEFFYSHRGRTDAAYGDEIDSEKWPITIVFSFPMDEAMIKKAPRVEESMAVTHGYVISAIIGMILAFTIKNWGFEARNHMDGNYLMVLPIAAKSAGIGDFGQHGLIVTKDFGPRVRLGAVTTNAPLELDSIENSSMKESCIKCGRCFKTCPSKAISSIYGEPIVQEKCFAKWLEFGTDCGVCISVCPGYQI